MPVSNVSINHFEWGTKQRAMVICYMQHVYQKIEFLEFVVMLRATCFVLRALLIFIICTNWMNGNLNIILSKLVKWTDCNCCERQSCELRKLWTSSKVIHHHILNKYFNNNWYWPVFEMQFVIMNLNTISISMCFFFAT